VAVCVDREAPARGRSEARRTRNLDAEPVGHGRQSYRCFLRKVQVRGSLEDVAAVNAAPIRGQFTYLADELGIGSSGADEVIVGLGGDKEE